MYALDLLFVYGTLHPDRAPAVIAPVVRSFVPLGSASVRGRLHRFHDYPAVRLDPAGDVVPGTLFRVPPGTWPALDAYEGFEPEAPANSLFLRERTLAHAENGSEHECWIYVYAHPLPDLPAR